ncbi:glycosyltransferase family 1 protein [Spirosoma harenae]
MEISIEIPSFLPEKSDLSNSAIKEDLTTLIPNDRLAQLSIDCTAVIDLLCFSHLRWNFVYQRPQHLLSRAACQWRVWYIEEPIWADTTELVIEKANDRLSVVIPYLAHGMEAMEAIQQQKRLIDQLLVKQAIQQYACWYYTPMALPFSDHLQPALTVYDCMDELSAFRHAPQRLLELEVQLLTRADLVFTGGLSLYDAKKDRHRAVFAFPSSIDFTHFEAARHDLPEPADQLPIPRPHIGFCGVIDERLDTDLLRALADQRPNWHFVLIGPVVKIDPASLPQGPNLHYLGPKTYSELPAYFSHWQVAMMPFALNEATRYISPTKTPEYLAAGLPVVSTPIRDVVRTYGAWLPVLIADSPATFEQAIARTLSHQIDNWTIIDDYLQTNSWDTTWASMNSLMQTCLNPVFQ